MNTSHTPGPWHVNSTEAHGEACAYAAVIIGPESAGSPCIASLEFGGTIETDSETTKANARLIASAPETAAERDRLRDALKESLAVFTALARRQAPHSGPGCSADLTDRAIDKLTAILAGTPDTETDRLRASNAELLAALNQMNLLATREGWNTPIFKAEFGAALRAARTAIAKAEGRS